MYNIIYYHGDLLQNLNLCVYKGLLCKHWVDYVCETSDKLVISIFYLKNIVDTIIYYYKY